MSTAAYEGFAIVELMGHRRVAGKVSEATVAGVTFLRVDIPKGDAEGTVATQFYSGQAIYCMTPTSEEVVKAMARSSQHAPVAVWELNRAPVAFTAPHGDGIEDVPPSSSPDLTNTAY